MNTENKIAVMEDYNNGVNILVRRNGSSHWVNPLTSVVNFNWSLNEYKTKKSFAEAAVEYTRNLDFSDLPNPTNLKSECAALMYEAFLQMDVNKVVIKSSDHFFVNLIDYENDTVTVTIYYFEKKFARSFVVDRDSGANDERDIASNAAIQILSEAEYQALPAELKNNGTTYLTY